ncbi:MAG: hypothetical protein LBN39_04500, partial [Planctomycetaceae bacterium]|nr:hypothetical protein [Planctomycetaceae bacterium]
MKRTIMLTIAAMFLSAVANADVIPLASTGVSTSNPNTTIASRTTGYGLGSTTTYYRASLDANWTAAFLGDY